MRITKLPLLAAAVMTLTGCAARDEIFAARDFLSDPKTSEAVSNLRAGATIFVCAVANAQALASSIYPAINAGQSLTGTGNKVLTASTSVCGSLRGAAIGSTTAQAGQSVATSKSSVATVQ